MRKQNMYREYRLKSYLNMSHYIIINGKQGQSHPHTWEFVATMVVIGEGFVQFSEFESLMEQYLDRYQDKIINTVPPFDTIVPTIENVTDYFYEELKGLLHENGGELVSMEGSEAPTRSYIISRKNEPEFIEQVGRKQAEQISGVIRYIVGQIAGAADEN